MPSHILILDDDADVALAARLLLRQSAERVDTLGEPRLLAHRLRDGVPGLVLLDLNFTPGRTDGSEGLAALAQLRALPQPPSVIVMTAYADIPLAVEAMKRGACDFITKPWNNDRLLAMVENALSAPTPMPSAASGTGALLGQSKAIRDLRALIAQIGPTDANVLVLGENGTGKELVARALHQCSRRAAKAFMAVDMGALPESTLESELFGHRKGAFTDARNDRAGRFQAAAGGTLFLDEIGNLPLPAQARLLAALERREVTPLGADRAEAVDVRVVSATNLDEARLRDPQSFRTDLLFRLNTIVVRVPPLRERREDIPLLVRHYLAHYEKQYTKPARLFAADAEAALGALQWDGNVRALRHACERAVILSEGGRYEAADFGQEASAPVENTPARSLDTLEREAVAAALDQCKGNISRAARLLGVSRAALYRRLEKHGL
ncbi:sigma-54 dependent transcriptional regulator [Duganella sp. Root1480D1]|uniref:sigma-54-dependent transcriptional regulator n=1 Tax=Duganella sp. Root1480D1 TaxID=1736471 RepID=UPI00070A0F1D|nr:sigma-54 dependent transcriptional regulator [Duganella sp. Root1480D1]KQZ39795.1 two-component system response regulator [Duganella sp. Root1480D1]